MEQHRKELLAATLGRTKSGWWYLLIVVGSLLAFTDALVEDGSLYRCLTPLLFLGFFLCQFGHTKAGKAQAKRALWVGQMFLVALFSLCVMFHLAGRF